MVSRSSILRGHRRLLSTSAPAIARSPPRPILFTSSALLLSTIAWYSFASPSPLLAESAGDSQDYESTLTDGQFRAPAVFLWGRHWHDGDSPNIIKRPRRMASLDGAALRDLALHAKYGVAVDAKGNVLQWGLGLAEGSEETLDVTKPIITLKGKDISRVAVADTKIYALSRSGKVYVFPCDLESQRAGSEERIARQSWFMSWFKDPDATDVEQLVPDVPMSRGEGFISIATGDHHLLALTSSGRAFASPISSHANTAGQLGVRRVTLAGESGPQLVEMAPDLSMNDARWEIPSPPPNLDPLLLSDSASTPSTPSETNPPPSTSNSSATASPTGPQNGSIRFCTTLHEIPALRGLSLIELRAGANHSLALTSDNKVLGWGANNYGQLGLGASLSYPTIPTPTEIPLGRSYPKASRVACTSLAAGGNNSYFVVERWDILNKSRDIDVLATGQGQFGGIGNGGWAHVATPVRVKTISGLQEWSDHSQKVDPIPIRELCIGRTHAVAVLDNAVKPGGIQFGRDVFVWGHNEWYQLGTGKRSNLSIPQHLKPLPYPGSKSALSNADTLSSGTISPMPHSRLQLYPGTKVNGYLVEETIVTGDGGSAVYWRIIQ